MRLRKTRSSAVAPNACDGQKNSFLESKPPIQTRQELKFRELFRYASTKELILVCLGVLLSSIVGAAFPFSIFVFRLIVNDFMDPDVQSAAQNIYRTSIWFSVIAACAFILAFLQTLAIDFSSSAISERIRLKFFQAIFRQDIAWFDQQAVGTLVNQLADDTANIQLGIGVKLTEFVQNMSSFFVGLLIACISAWKLTLVACCMLPFIMIGFVSFGGLTHYFIRKESEAYAKANAIAEEVIYGIRTVLAFGGQRREEERYARHLNEAANVGVRQASIFGLAAGFISLSVYSSAALVFWYGISLLNKGEYDAGSVILVFLNVIIGSLFLGGALPNFRYFFAAKASAKRVFEIIERVPPIDKNQQGLKPDNFFQSLKFTDVTFSYATRPDKVVLEKFNLSVEHSQTVALVGPSGCGKSTVLNLLQRLYDPVSGTIEFDNCDLRDLDLQWYRSLISVVQQEPVLFTGTIADNIRMGKPNASMEEIIEAAKLSNAHKFIASFPEGYETKITQGSTALSVGQKQRLAIARALVRNPRILILDEATSALDSQSEEQVQAALDQACVGRTVFIVAHRLSTVRKADLVVVIENGRISESGTHELLSSTNGLYSAMLKAQGQLSNEYDTSPHVQGDKTEENSCSPLESDDVKAISPLTDVVMTSYIPDKQTGKLRPLALKAAPPGSSRRTHSSSAWMRVLRLNRPETGFIIFGALSAALTGALQPIFAVLYSEIYAVFTMTGNPSEMNSRVNYVAGIMTLLGFLRMASSTFQAYCFGVAGQRLTRRLRKMLFHAILQQETAWFDEPDQQVGTLTVKLASEANKIHPLCGSAMGRIIESVVLVALSLTVGFCYNWKLTLIVVIFFPVIMLSSFLQTRQLRRAPDSDSKTSATQVAYEALSANRTVTAFGLEAYFYECYSAYLHPELRSRERESFGFGVVYALAQSLPICSYAAAFSFGAYLMSHGEIALVSIFRVFAAISFAAQALGRSSHLGTDLRNAARASTRIFRILEREPRIPVSEGMTPMSALNEVPIVFNRVSFSYASRPAAKVLKSFTQTIDPGQTVALVGHSGCGKSTVFKLLQRLYDCIPASGTDGCGIFLGSYRIETVSPTWLRQQIGIVDQEPHLFDLTIRENIAYGDNSRDVTMSEITEAASHAQIHDFIASLPHGYDTPCGQHGRELSTGQKQRIALARMFIHRPNVLLLDEATSALDPPTEKKIQNALNEFARNRTMLISAHRLSAIEGADLAVVLADGVKVEAGKPAELVQMNGIYCSLYYAQTRCV
ncbi:ATP-dependent translocase ABCB1 [Clonorchis sinensis]|uniref:ATP-dependent translocase ABCB1 n=1 Tax=Clonorchis sinensis TaxID=79923 RepID=A0A8T1MNM2_CLOSI|nr:ATP-dependent translocase ABCB1 [Clonorchis sinensis]